MTDTSTWADKLAAAERAKGRKLTLDEVLALSATHKMTEDEIQAQRESWVRAMKPTGDPRFD